MAVRVEVELDIFSGMPNPTWVLTAAEATSFVQRLAAVSGTAAGEPSGKLGYRGFIVQMTDGARTQSIRIQAGAVRISNGETIRAADQDRALERWLLDTGKPHLRNDLLAAVEREFPARRPPADATPPHSPTPP